MTKSISNYYAICSLWIAKELEEKGFKCVKKEPNIHKPEFDVFFFDDSNELRKEVRKLRETR